jgi:hypothetical protein
MKPTAAWIALLSLLALTGCESMKGAMGKMKEGASTAKSEAESNLAAAQEGEVNRRNRIDGETVAAGGGAAAASTSSTSSASGESGSASADAPPTDSSDDVAVEEAVSESETTAPAAGSESYDMAAMALANCEKPSNTPEQADLGGDQRHPWSDAEKGWFLRVRMAQGMETTTEVKDVTERCYLSEVKMYMNGGLMSCQLAWQPRFYAPVDPTEPQEIPEYEQKITDLPNETVEINGKSVDCQVKKYWTRVAGEESTSVIWTSDEVLGGTVKTAVETENGLEVVYQIVEWRKG